MNFHVILACFGLTIPTVLNIMQTANEEVKLPSIVALDKTDVGVFIIAISTILTALSIITKNGRQFWLWTWARVKSVHGFMKVSKRVKALEEKLEAYGESINGKLDAVLAEVKPNGGTSLKDMMNSVMLNMFIESEARRRLLDGSGLAYWEADAEGKWVYASEKLAELIGLTPEECRGDGWVTTLIDEDKSRIVRRWREAVEQKRRFVESYTFAYEKETIRVQGMSYPLIQNQRVVGFVGILTKLKDEV